MTVLRLLARLFRFALMTLWQLAALHTRLSVSPLSQHRRHRNQALKQWADGTLRIFGFQVQVIGDLASDQGPRLVLANHRSPFDIPAVLSVIQARTMGQAAVRKWPLLGGAAKAADTIFVDRQDKESGKQAIAGARRALMEHDAVLLFPEGTTFEGDTLRAFKLGGISAAQGSDAVIVPIGLCYEEGFGYADESLIRYLMRVSQKPHSQLTLAVGPSIRPQQTVEQSATLAHDAISLLIQQARAFQHHHPSTNKPK